MKKVLLKVLVICLVICSALCVFTACGGDGGSEQGAGAKHIHTYSDKWSYDDEFHWHVATCEHTNEVSGKERHKFINGLCEVCGKEEVIIKDITVVLDANGGIFSDNSASKSISVKSGSKFTEIETPVREKYDFTFWYKNSALTEVWDFDNDIVSNEITLYAGWEYLVEEHNVTYVLNFDGAENVVESTIDGLVAYIPVRNGYVFNGWWISDGLTTEGEYILVQKWDTQEIVDVSDLTLYAEWVEESTVSTQLPAPSVSINEGVFSWQTISGAVSYNVRVYASGSNEQLIGETIQTTTWTIPSGYDFGYYTVRIRANGDGFNTVNSAYVSKSYGHRILSTVAKINFDLTTSVLTWSTVRNATSYELYVNNIKVKELTYASYDMSDYEAGVYDIKIYAKKDGYQPSVASKTINKLRLKTPIVNLLVDKNNEQYTLKWKSVYYADTYILRFGETEIRLKDISAYEYAFNNMANFWDGDTIEFSMTAYDSSADYLVSLPTEVMTINKLYKFNIEKSINQAGNVSETGAFFVPKTYKVDFNLNGADGEVASQTISANNGLYYTCIPEREGYVFRGWYTTAACTELYDFTQTISEDMTLYAGWYNFSTTTNAKAFDFTSEHYSSSTAYSTSTSASMEYVYFCALTSGTYTIYYKNSSSSSNYGTYLLVRNVTKNTNIKSNTKITSTTYQTLSMDLDVGDIVYIRSNASNSSYPATFYYYLMGATRPTAGGRGTDKFLIKGNENSFSSSTMYVDYSTQITVTATTNNGYTWVGWYDGETLLTNELNYTFTMPSANIIYTAKWIETPVMLEKSIAEAGSVSITNNQKVGAETTITAATNNGYTWIGWYNGETLLTNGLSYSFTMPGKNVTYTAKWIETPLILEKSIAEAGSVSITNNQKVGADATITAATNNGYTWIGWYDGETLLTNELSYTFTMPSKNIIY
ncbi:MAG: InlB B-repeat-containing protein [Clostridia bacterium]|nr:InlB B-repeat-containing protein [Clostridia bacterium]